MLFGVMFAALMVLPYIDRNPSRKFKDRKVALSGFVVAVALIGFLTYAGLPFYGIQETATSELVFEWVPGEGEGKVDEVPFAQLPGAACTWDSFTKSFTVCDEPALTPEARKIYEDFQSDVDYWLTLDKAFRDQNGSATLMIAPWQLNQQGEVMLEKVVLQISVNGKQQAPAVRFISRSKDNVSQ